MDGNYEDIAQTSRNRSLDLINLIWCISARRSGRIDSEIDGDMCGVEVYGPPETMIIAYRLFEGGVLSYWLFFDLVISSMRFLA